MAREDPQLKLRLPVGLRDRVKAYAEKHGRSMNTEILRILEREFPEPLSLKSKLHDLLDALDVLKEGIANKSVERAGDALSDILNAIADGRIRDVDAGIRSSIRDRLEEIQYEHLKYETLSRDWDLDPEEKDTKEHGEGTAKYPDVPVFGQHFDKKDERSK